MSERPSAGTRLCRLDEIADPGAKGFSFGAFAGLVVRRGEAVSGFVDSCPHTGVPLALMGDRYLTREKDLIVCSTHGALFRPADGLCVAGPCAGDHLAPWPVAVSGEDVVTA